MIATSPNLRTALLAGTALIFPVVAQAQPAPNARPQGGAVVAGSATIGGDAGRTVINQSTDRAAIDWQSFDIGRNQAVQFQQPGSTSVTLNRVISSNPSQIAGQITANGQVAIVNQSGVIFYQGSTVNAAGLVVSTANITNEAFMRGGRMNFDQPGRPDARIENNGTITVREAGLAALVAPQVANHGVIRARMGRVVLAGAETSVVDLHGDGLLSLEVTSPVRQAPTNGQALVTNTGTVTATGGTVVLTASAVDGIVQDLVRAGGRIAANTDPATGRTGRVVVTGNGGAVRIEGTVSAEGRAAGTTGGDIQILGDRTLVAGTAQVNASGRAGGGSIAIGVTPDGTANRRLSQRAGISRGAVVRADATERGNGGTVLLNSTDFTAHAGAISARGGPQGGNGGFVEVSGQQGLTITGTVNVLGGPGGQNGTFLIDPTNLSIVNGTGPDDGLATDGQVLFGEGSGNATIGTNVLNGFAGDLVLQATNNLTVFGNLLPQLNLSMSAGNTLTVAAGGSIVANSGAVNLTALNFVFNGPVTSTGGQIFLSAAGFGATVTQSAAGILTANSLGLNNPGSFTSVNLGADNVLNVFNSQNTQLGPVFLRNIGSLRVTGTVGSTSNSAVRIDVVGGDLTIAGMVGGDGAGFDGVQALLRASGNLVVESGGSVVGPAIRMQAGFNFGTNAPDPAAAGGIQLAGFVG
ncbi:MAG: hypothetical protein JWR00_3997, partial [Rubritepida sp.]|nr:hypothetical protein [Rubritepida sp.]